MYFHRSLVNTSFGNDTQCHIYLFWNFSLKLSPCIFKFIIKGSLKRGTPWAMLVALAEHPGRYILLKYWNVSLILTVDRKSTCLKTSLTRMSSYLMAAHHLVLDISVTLNVAYCLMKRPVLSSLEQCIPHAVTKVQKNEILYDQIHETLLTLVINNKMKKTSFVFDEC